MNIITDPFTLVVPYKEEERQFDAELRRFGYSHKIMVNVEGTEIIFEPDEERNYRATLSETDTSKKLPDIELLKAVAAALEEAFKS
jgi:hypothetical protein